MEAAAGLANVLYEITRRNEHPSAETVEKALATTTAKTRKRLDALHVESRWVTRLESCQGLLTTAFARYLAPHCGDLFALGVVRNSYNGAVLDYLPLTDRSGKNWPELEWWNTWGLSKWQDVFWKLAYLCSFLTLIWYMNLMPIVSEL